MVVTHFFHYSLDSDDENTLNQNNLAIDSTKLHKKRKKQKDKSKVIYFTSCVTCKLFNLLSVFLLIYFRNQKSLKK